MKRKLKYREVLTYRELCLHFAAVCVWVLSLKFFVAATQTLDWYLCVTDFHELQDGVVKEDVLALRCMGLGGGVRTLLLYYKQKATCIYSLDYNVRSIYTCTQQFTLQSTHSDYI